MDIFPYTPRPCQTQMMKSIRETLSGGGHALIEAPTGTGKTIAALVPIFEYLQTHPEKRFLYLTRTNAQQRQVLIETRKIKERVQTELIVTGFQGRKNLCPLVRENPNLKNGNADELSWYCIEKKKRHPNAGGCIFYRTLCEKKMDEHIVWVIKTIPAVEDLYKRMKEMKICPYEFIKKIMERAHGVVAPYLYFFDAHIRQKFLEYMNIETKDLIIVIDEAHNLPDFLRGIASCKYSVNAIHRARSEAKSYKDPLLAEGIPACRFFDAFEDALRDIAEESLKKDDEACIPAPSLQEELMINLGISSITLDTIISSLIALGEKIRIDRLTKNELPRSYLLSAGVFLKIWKSIDDERYVRIITSKGSPVISGCCLDASLMATPLHGVHASIHISGTLSPLEQYRDILGLPPDRTRFASLSSPFPKENRKIVYSPQVTTCYRERQSNEQETERIWKLLRRICDSISRNTVVFFPSFRLLEEFTGSEWGRNLTPAPYIERQEMHQVDVMEMVEVFKKRVGSPLMFAVAGGRLSEGLDFPDRELDIVIIVGIPYPRPDPLQDALQRYYEQQFGPQMGWEYAVQAPTVRRLLQCIGRLIRSETDRGIAIILDKRAKRFRSYLPDMGPSSDPVAEIKAFFHE